MMDKRLTGPLGGARPRRSCQELTRGGQKMNGEKQKCTMQ